MPHDESTLPKWAQRELAALRARIKELRGVEAAHAVLIGREWFTLQGPDYTTPDEVRHLWFLNREQPFPACSLAYGDILLVGRGRNRWGGTPVPLDVAEHAPRLPLMHLPIPQEVLDAKLPVDPLPTPRTSAQALADVIAKEQP